MSVKEHILTQENLHFTSAATKRNLSHDRASSTLKKIFF